MVDSPRKLVLGHADLGAALETVGSAGDKAGSVRVERFVPRSSALQPLAMLVDDRRRRLAGLPPLEEGDDGPLEEKLDQVHGEVPDNVPDPDDTDPAARDRMNLGEAPVAEASDDR